MSRLTSAPVLALSFVIVTILAAGPLVEIDQALNYRWWKVWPEGREPLRAFERLGQRAVCLPVLFLVAAHYARRLRSWQPVVLAAAGMLVLNLVVGSLKLLTARGQPRISDPSFFAEGLMYPSGHAANAVLVYGLAVYLVWRYGRLGRAAMWVLTLLVAGVAAAMVAVGLYFQWHWFSDLVAGFLIGGLVLRLSVTGHRRLQRRPRFWPAHRRRHQPEVPVPDPVRAGGVRS